jgi:uncharacterized protein YcbX
MLGFYPASQDRVMSRVVTQKHHIVRSTINMAYVKEIFIHPVKSLRGISVTESEVDPYGFKHDRKFMVCETDLKNPGKYKFSTQRQYPQFTLIQPTIDGERNVLTLTYPPENIQLSIPLSVSSEIAEKCPVLDTLIWEEYPRSLDLSAVYPEITAFFEIVTGKTAASDHRITLVAPFIRREVSMGLREPDRATIDRETPESAYQDYFPGNLICEKSLRDLDSRVQEKTNGEVKLSPRNFRPNMVIANTEQPWDEDDWKRIKIGNHKWIVPCRNIRCQITTVNLSSGKFETTREPYKTMQSFRRIDTGSQYAPCFGMNLINCDTQFTVKVGDQLTVLERGEHHYPRVLKG